MKRTLLYIFVLALLVVVIGHSQTAVAQGNLLQNASFEQPYDAGGAANGWGRWHRDGGNFSDCSTGYAKQPHWSAELNPALVRDGSASQHVGNNWDTWNGGVFQTVAVTPGSTYRFTVWAYSFGSNNNFPGPSDGGLNSNIRVGIDPNGSGLWNDADVVWSGSINPLDNWQSISVEVAATGNQISVFTAANWGVSGVNQCRKHLDSWFDQAELVVVGPPPTNTPLPAPTQPPAPLVTNTPVPPPPTNTPEVQPTSTAVPTNTPVPTDTAVPGGSLCVNAFADDNANGSRDANEGYMGSVTFTISSATQLVGQAISSGTANPVCFEGLAAGDYTVTQIVPAALQMTTAGNTAVALQVGQVVGVEFGSRVSTAAPTAVTTEVAVVPTANTDGQADGESGTTSSSSGPSLLTIGGLALLAGAVVLLGVLVFLGLRGQKSA